MRRASPGRRLRITLLCIAFALTVFAGRLVQLEGFDSAAYKTDSAQEHPLIPISLPAVRGDITTSDGALLTATVQTETVYADPKLIPVAARPEVAASLAAPLKLTAAAILHRLNHPSSPDYVKLASGVSVGTGTRITALALPGIDMHSTYTTSYPDADLAGPVTGFTNTDLKDGTLFGVQGLEQQYNALLAGRPGREYAEQGVDGQPIPNTEVDVTPAVPARSLRLTLQSSIQYEADQVCRQRVEQTHATSCSIVVMQPKTGAILAMAQWPTFNPATVSSLARAEGMRPQSMGTVVATLEAAGLLTGAPDPDDGRQTLWSLTQACASALRENRAARQDWLARTIEARLSAREQAQLASAVELLKRLVQD